MELTSDLVINSLSRISQVLHDNRQVLIDLDSPIGDADHGINMDRGFTAVQSKLDASQGQDVGAILKMVASTLISTVGIISPSRFWRTGLMLLRAHLRPLRMALL